MAKTSVALRLSVYPTKTSALEIFLALGGEENYNQDANRLTYDFTSPETIQEICGSVIKKYMNEEYMLKWFNKVDETIKQHHPDPAKFDGYIELHPFIDAYDDIEREWLHKHDDVLSEKMIILRSVYGSNEDMKAATDDDWNDALILNMNNRNVMGIRWEAGRDTELKSEWIDLIDDLMLLYAATALYVGIRAYGEISAYAI